MFLNDAEIEALMAEMKPTVDATVLLRRLATSDLTRGHRRHSVTVTGALGSRFDLHLRQNALDPYDFSVILSHVSAEGSFNLRRHNGPSHSHQNPLEGTAFRNQCHAHMATERYQLRGNDPEHYAEATNAFVDLASAVQRILEDASFEPPAQTTFDLS